MLIALAPIIGLALAALFVASVEAEHKPESPRMCDRGIHSWDYGHGYDFLGIWCNWCSATKWPWTKGKAQHG